jgi:hypothetical protein
MHIGFCLGYLEENNHLDNLDVDRKIIVNRILIE